jgi:hypothetical protein
MRTPSVVGLVLLALLFSGVARADWITGSTFLDHCSHELDWCLGYVSGVADTDVQFKEFVPQMAFCPPSGITKGQLGEVAIKYLKAHPADLHLPSSALLLSAFKEAYPCANQGGAKP